MTSNERVKVLVIDDSETILDATQLALEESGYQVVTLSSPATFHRVLTRERPDLVMVDVSMPVVEGQVLIEIARRNRLSSCPIVLYSAQPENRLRLLVEKCGADGYVRKTNDDVALRAAVARCLSEAAARRAAAAPARRPHTIWLATGNADLKAKLGARAAATGCGVTSYDNPEDCVGALSAGLPLAVLLDADAHPERARSACQQIKGHPQWAAVPVMITANTPSEILRCWRWGADDFLLTPPQPGHLESKLAALSAPGVDVLARHPGGCVLYLERDTYARARIGDALEHAGFRLRYAVNDAEALRALSDRAQPPQAVVVDLASTAPDLSFLAAARRAALTVATAASASTSPELVAQAESALRKPVIASSPRVMEDVVAAVSTGLTGAPSRLDVNPRAPFHALVEFKSPTAESWRAGVTFDVSRNGLFIRTLASEPARTRLSVRVTLPNGRVATCEGSVAWSNPYAARAVYSYPVGMGVHLTGMDAAYLEAIGPLTEPRPTGRSISTRQSG